MFFIYFLLLCSFLLFLISFIINIKSHRYDGRSEGKIVSLNKVCHNGRNNKVYIYYPIYEYNVDGITYQEEFPFGDKCPNNLKRLVISSYFWPSYVNYLTCGNIR